MAKHLKQTNNQDKALIYEVDQLIANTGSYQAIELLLQTGLLPYSDYEQWRMGKEQYLSDTFINNHETIILYLDNAQAYAQSLGMVSEPLNLKQWQRNGVGTNLEFCPEKSSYANKLNSHYVRINDDQMDLFFDNQSLVLVSDLKRALISRDIRLANEKIQLMYGVDPSHEILKPAKILLDALVDALEEDEIADPRQEMNDIITHLRPLAEKALAGQERDYLSLFWRRLANVIDDSAYTEAESSLHSSFCYQQIPDWQAVIDSIKSNIKDTTNSISHPTLLIRYIIALNKSSQYQQYLQSLYQFFWQFPRADYSGIIENDISLKNNLNNFMGDEFDKQWGYKHFPAWLAINTPGVCHHIAPTSETPEVFKLLQELILTEIKQQKQVIPLRKQLQQAHAGIFEYYLDSV